MTSRTGTRQGNQAIAISDQRQDASDILHSRFDFPFLVQINSPSRFLGALANPTARFFLSVQTWKFRGEFSQSQRALTFEF